MLKKWFSYKKTYDKKLKKGFDRQEKTLSSPKKAMYRV